jgi:Putative prokaryotic signal transducing protein
MICPAPSAAPKAYNCCFYLSIMMPVFCRQSGAIVANASWVSVATYSDKISAEAILGLLTGEGLPAYIESDEHVPGLGTRFSVFVPNDRERQAQRILEQGQVSDTELTELAMAVKPDE